MGWGGCFRSLSPLGTERTQGEDPQVKRLESREGAVC